MRHFLLVIFLGFGLYLSTSAQMGNSFLPVEWTFEIDSQPSDSGTFNLYFKAEIDKGWYVYSQFLDGDGPIPTALYFPKVEGFEIVGQATEEGDASVGYDPLFEIQIKKFKVELILTQTIRPTSDQLQIEGFLEYMTCDDTKCLPPAEVPFSFSLSRTN